MNLNKWLTDTFEVTHAKNKKIFPMEGARGFAALLVFFVHFAVSSLPFISPTSNTHYFVKVIGDLGNIGVDLFFVLSGFLIYGMQLKRKTPFGKYIKRRIVRIYPTFLAVTLIYVVLSFIFPHLSKIPSGFDGAIYMIQNLLLLPGMVDIVPLNSVTWSLSFEMFFYLLIPFLMVTLRLRDWNPKHRLLLLIVSSVVGFVILSQYTQNIRFDGPIRLIMFFSGMILYELSNPLGIRNLPPIGLASLLLAIGVNLGLNYFNLFGWWVYPMLFTFFLLFCWECFFSEGLTAKIFSYTPMRWFGNMSYSYYLIHALGLKFIFLIIGKFLPINPGLTWEIAIILPFAFVATLIPSVILFIFVEKRFSF